MVTARVPPSLWRHGAFRKLWAAQSISLLGSQVTTLALPLAAIVTLQASAFEMGLLRVATSLPGLLFSLVVGVWVDRVRRRPLLIGADLARAVLLASNPVVALLHHLTIFQLYVVAFLTAALTILFDVAQLSLLPVLVEPSDLVEGNNPTRPAAYPANGRTLTDDVEHVFLRVLTNGQVTDGKVGPHADVLAEFPYVGAPHTAPRTAGRTVTGATG